jgi:hypothetical protein
VTPDPAGVGNLGVIAAVILAALLHAAWNGAATTFRIGSSDWR